MNVAIILAGGMGKRMKADKNKVRLKMAQKPIIFYTLKIFEEVEEISGIVLVVGKDDEIFFKHFAKKYKFKKIKGIILGGKERQDSAFNGLKYTEKIVKNKRRLKLLFHNGANPFVTKKEIKEVLLMAEKYGASAVAQKTKDTIRKVDQRGLSLGVVDRSNLWNMQTPQVIKFSLAKQAFEQAKADNFLGTDDVSLVERLRKKVKIIPASENNFKITTPLDLSLARLMFRENKKLFNK